MILLAKRAKFVIILAVIVMAVGTAFLVAHRRGWDYHSVLRSLHKEPHQSLLSIIDNQRGRINDFQSLMEEKIRLSRESRKKLYDSYVQTLRDATRPRTYTPAMPIREKSVVTPLRSDSGGEKKSGLISMPEKVPYGEDQEFKNRLGIDSGHEVPKKKMSHEKRVDKAPDIKPGKKPKGGVFDKKKNVRLKGDTQKKRSALASLYPYYSGKGAVHYHGARSEKRVALTFDAGDVNDSEENITSILDTLVRTETPATFFLSGRWIEKRREHSRRLANVKYFELGNHTYRHPDLTKLSAGGIRREMESTQRIIQRVTGKVPSLFRPPFGRYDNRVRKEARRLKLSLVLWDVGSDDYLAKKTSDDIAGATLKHLSNGSIVLLHINGDAKNTHKALPGIIEGIRKKEIGRASCRERV